MSSTPEIFYLFDMPNFVGINNPHSVPISTIWKGCDFHALFIKKNDDNVWLPFDKPVDNFSLDAIKHVLRVRYSKDRQSLIETFRYKEMGLRLNLVYKNPQKGKTRFLIIEEPKYPTNVIVLSNR